MSPGNPRTAILTCMDPRLDAAGFLDRWPAPVHIVRNAGGRATADALRSLAVSCAIGAERILVVHHTRCAMAEHTDEEIRGLLPAGADPAVDFLTIADPEQALREDVLTLRASALLPTEVETRGFVFDLDSGSAHEIEIETR